MSRITVVLVDPYPTCLDRARYLVYFVGITRPHPCSETIDGIVGKFNGFLGCFKGSKCDYRTEDFLLKYPHFIVALQDRRLDIESSGGFAFMYLGLSTYQHFGTLFLT